jgi:hypothetical protein
MPQLAIINKIGAAGDVLRTTSSLNVSRNFQVDWMIDFSNAPLSHGSRVLVKASASELEYDEAYGLVIPWEEDSRRLAEAYDYICRRRIIGTSFARSGKVRYARDKNCGFAKSLVSRFVISAADKKEARKTSLHIKR